VLLVGLLLVLLAAIVRTEYEGVGGRAKKRERKDERKRIGGVMIPVGDTEQCGTRSGNILRTNARSSG
jgi:hypothetical protein